LIVSETDSKFISAMAGLGRGSAVWVLLALGLLAAANVVTATTYQVGSVGGATGDWTVPSTSNGLDYQTWADGQTYQFGDELGKFPASL
jgi:hypothetical protein